MRSGTLGPNPVREAEIRDTRRWPSRPPRIQATRVDAPARTTLGLDEEVGTPQTPAANAASLIASCSSRPARPRSPGILGRDVRPREYALEDRHVFDVELTIPERRVGGVDHAVEGRGAEALRPEEHPAGLAGVPDLDRPRTVRPAGPRSGASMYAYFTPDHCVGERSLFSTFFEPFESFAEPR